ncbi:DUF2059 domain-containing protein [Caulobacter sp. S45]|uniref:DUF2059 domain-containing protein n=1 Tax=Caulobacter sp. S45 TaxID=1641861 RepID=UPI001575DE1D|nr:DUF2059 domain-containing protein [Caulobacter sp. S45]
MSSFRAAVIAATLVAATGVAMSACAQDAPLSTAAPDPVGLSPPVVSGAPGSAYVNGERLALAQQVFDITGAPALRAQARSLTAGLSVQLATAMSARDPAHAQAMVAAVGDGLTGITPQLQAEAVSRITRDFTTDQLKTMLTFYASPTGRLAARRMPLILQQTVGSVLTYLPQMMSGVEDSYCTRVKCTRAEKKAFEDVAARMAAAHPSAGAD